MTRVYEVPATPMTNYTDVSSPTFVRPVPSQRLQPPVFLRTGAPILSGPYRVGQTGDLGSFLLGGLFFTVFVAPFIWTPVGRMLAHKTGTRVYHTARSEYQKRRKRS